MFSLLMNMDSGPCREDTITCQASLISMVISAGGGLPRKSVRQQHGNNTSVMSLVSFTGILHKRKMDFRSGV